MKRLAFGASALLALAASGMCASASAQHWGIDVGPMRIPSLSELSRPVTPRVYTPVSPADAAGPLGPFLNDFSLRKGDVVVTSDGLMEFRGDKSTTHAPADFAPLQAGAGREQGRAFRTRAMPAVQTAQ